MDGGRLEKKFIFLTAYLYHKHVFGVGIHTALELATKSLDGIEVYDDIVGNSSTLTCASLV